MKIKELQKTVNVAWSPVQQYPIYLAAGTAAQQLDASNAVPVLEVYSANLVDASYDLELKGSQPSQYRFQKVVWSPAGIGGAHQNGLIVGGCESGHLQIYSAAKLLAGEEALVAHQDKHSGPIRGLDFNPFQHFLLASVASESEIFIWDLNNTSTPMAPGTKTQPLEDVQNVAWNKQVQHILASVFSTRCVIWDLRKNEQIIKLSDTQSRVRWSSIQWHPDIATQLWLGSEDDQAPYVQLWDLRYATAPAKILQIHQRGMLGLTWCPNDSDLMVSCGKDNKIYCWNPNSDVVGGEILSEIATTVQWYSDVQWCPRNPALLASSSLDGMVSIYSVFGGTHQQVQTTNKIADSFPGVDHFSQAPVPQATQVVYSDLKVPPKWMKRPAGASFGFGGRLIAFNRKSPQNVTISQVITDAELVERSNQLETTLQQCNYSEYCRMRADQMKDQHGRYVWYFLKANFEQNPRSEMLNLLGYNPEDVANKFQKYSKQTKDDYGVDQITNDMAALSRQAGDNNALFDAIAAGNKSLSELSEKKTAQFKIKTDGDDEGLICQAILSGNIEAAVELCMESGRPAEAIIIAITGGADLLTRTQFKYLEKSNSYLANIISSLVGRDWSNVAQQCTVDSWKEALVGILTHCQENTKDLCEKLGERLEKEGDSELSRNAILCYICAGNIEKLIQSWINLNKLSSDVSKMSTSELQDLVEIIMLMQKSGEVQGRYIEPTGKLVDFLSQYAGLLASQGALDSALTYLGPSDNPELAELRDRLYYALGYKKQAQQQPYARGSLQPSSQAYQYGRPPAPGNRFGQRNSITNPTAQPAAPLTNNFNTGLPGAVNAPSQPPLQPWKPPAPVSTFNPMQPQAVPLTSMPPMPPGPLKPPTINDGIIQPPRPSSVGSQGRSTPLTRSKYVLDPSVQSGPNYGQNMNMYNTPATQPLNANPPNPINPMQFNPNPIGSSAQPSYSMPQNFQQPVPPIQNNFKPLTPNANPIPNPGFNNPASYLSGVPPIEVAQQAMPPVQKNPTPPPGWNDPPALRSTRQQVQYNDRNKMSAEHAGTKKWQRIINSSHSHSTTTQGNFLCQPKSEPAPVAPITHPIFGVDPNANQNGYVDPNNAFNNQYQNPAQPTPMPIQSMQPQTNFSQPQQMNFRQQAIPDAYAAQAQEAQMPVKQEVPKEKPPLPEEYIYMQTVLEELKTQCINAATDPRTKRKVADIAKKLECLYDALRENRLTPNTLSALNQIVQYVQIGDYHNAMGILTVIVSGPDFSQTASFMPGIKVLLQSANELKVYLR
ncbi:protein transport protein Sec31A isoform X1 [Hermetia illucens]|uniref:protein transport protein Sec31A isoform X1 n=1 Tax=Hermetia illucens TaxID=343691 RepID=UPI0018CC4B10|nr:protein transport protein Sec31A isoform X1 [Hermetia illucens]